MVTKGGAVIRGKERGGTCGGRGLVLRWDDWDVVIRLQEGDGR